MRRKWFKTAPFVLATMSLAGCASNTESDFLCSAQVGTPCVSIGAVDGTKDAGRRALAERPADGAAKSLSQGTLPLGKSALAMRDGGHAYDLAAYRAPEVVGSIWIAPYFEGGILHEARFVGAVLREAAWRP